MANDYITFSNSNSSLTKKFRVLSSGYERMREKLGQGRVTVTGRLDNQVGAVRQKWGLMLKVYETDPTDPSGNDGNTEGYGTLAHLRTFFSYNDPNATPTNVITFTDHYGTAHSVYLSGSLKEKNQSQMIEGVNAVFHCQVVLEETEAL